MPSYQPIPPSTVQTAGARRRSGVVLAIGYALAFWAAHSFAAVWGGSYFFSLFYPAAGVRFALLWRFGLQRLPLVVLTELTVQYLSGIIQPGSANFFDQFVGVARAPLAYGLAIMAVGWVVKRGGSDIATPPMPLALATVLAPITASLASLGWSIIAPAYMTYPSSEPKITTTIAFMVGDLLGVLLLAPALLVMASVAQNRRLPWRLTILHGVEAMVVFGCGWALAVATMQVSLSLMLTPIMLTTAWIGLRCGRVAAWIAIVLVAVIALPISGSATDIPTRMALHMGLAAIAISGYLAGSYADAQRNGQLDIARRDRMLYQAERLKTLRAMSVAVIHEISQPLSTLSIESRYLAELGADPASSREEIGEIATLLERKVGALSDMVRRLRRFGGRAVDEPSPIAVRTLVRDMHALIRAEAAKSGVTFDIADMPPDLSVMGQEIELVQALMNLTRNAVAAAPGRSVGVTVALDGDRALIRITNHLAQDAPAYGGMGVGTLVARAIVEAHGGTVVREDADDGRIAHIISLPSMETTDG